MVTYTILVGEPHAERFKPVPQLAAVIRDARAATVMSIAIQGVAGGYGLIFYTQPHVDIIGANADPHAALFAPRAVRS